MRSPRKEDAQQAVAGDPAKYLVSSELWPSGGADFLVMFFCGDAGRIAST